MKRKIINIDRELCDGCGQCVDACAEGAIALIDGKAELVSEIYCDGLGACIGDCPQGALTIEEREADAFDEKAVEKHLENLKSKEEPSLACGCPGSAMRMLTPDDTPPRPEPKYGAAQSQLGHWPVQMKLVPPQAPFLKNADVLLCADCVPFALPNFHSTYLKGHAVLVGCPKLDDLEYYREKLKDIFTEARPRSLTVLKMEVPCCNGIAHAALEAAQEVLPDLPVEIHTIGVRGEILDKVKLSSGIAQAQGAV